MKTIYIPLFLLVLPLMGLSQSGLLGSYPFNGNANDVSGNNNNGGVFGATLTNDRFNNSNSAYLFDGVNDYIDLGSGFSYLSHSFTCWAKKDSTGNNLLISKIENGNFDFKNSELYINDYGIGNGNSWISTSNTLYTNYDVNEWNFYVGTYNSISDTAKFYVNGNLSGKIKVNAYSHESSTKLQVGVRPFWSGVNGQYMFFKGAIDDINIYGGAITQPTIDSLYNIGITTGVNNIVNNDIKVFPNPTKEFIYFSNLSGLNKILIFDITGRKILNNTTEQKIHKINTSTFNNGIYLYQITNESGEIKTGKFIVD